MLHTPFEVSDYLSFCKDIALKDPNADTVSEKALLGQYLMDPDPTQLVSRKNEEYVDRLVRDAKEFSLSGLLAVYLDRTTFGADGTEYHAILAELAKLRRHMAREFWKLFAWAMDVCKGSNNLAPSRFFVPALGCSYIFIPLDTVQRDNWKEHLMPMTHLCKHDFRSPKCLGLTVAADPADSEFFLVNWLYIEFPWQPDERADALIREIKPFRKSSEKWTPMYHFSPR
jgi:hypothetical protein